MGVIGVSLITELAAFAVILLTVASVSPADQNRIKVRCASYVIAVAFAAVMTSFIVMTLALTASW